jgi:polysaccharide export outer membrane protein
VAATAGRATAQEIPAAAPTVVRSVGVLRPGDVLDVTVYRDKELSNKYLIDATGTLQIPGLGVIQAAGLEPQAVKDRLVEALRAQGFTNPQIAVQPLVRISVLGQVRNPGLFPVEPGTSLLQLVTIAGGPNDRADLRRVGVVRDGRRFEVDLESGLSGSAAGRITLISNDLVVVPQRRGFSREDFGIAISALGAVLSVVNIVISLRR